jgi:8-oxo-dGTP pyrophosphatase MutT (NUDIX family)
LQWIIKKAKTILKTLPFDVEELDLRDAKTGSDISHPFYRLSCPDWANILAITESGEAVLVKQSRVGPAKQCLEIPGGMIDEGEPAIEAAKRELEEETGYVSDDWTALPSINPNPAIMSNRLHMFLARNCRNNHKRQHFPDENESIEVVLVPVENLEAMVEKGEIDSALAALTVYMGRKLSTKS